MTEPCIRKPGIYDDESGSMSGPAGRAVGHDGGMHVIAGEYIVGRNRAIKFRQRYLVR